MHPLLRFAFKNLNKSKARTILAILAVFLGVLLITALLVLTDSLVSTVDGSLEVLSGRVIVQGEGSLDPSQSLINESVMDVIISENKTGGLIDGKIEAYAKEIWHNEKSNTSDFGFSSVIGVIPSQEIDTVGVIAEENIVAGRTLNDDDFNATIIGIATAAAMQLIPGNYIEVSGYSIQIVGIFVSDSFLEAAMFMPLDTVRLFKQVFSENWISTIIIKPIDIQAEEEIINYVNINLASEFEVEASDVDNLAEQGRQFLEITTDFAFYLGLISVIIGSLSVFNAILMSVSERKREIAVLKATGWKDKEIGFEVFIESIIIGLIGGVFGVFAGIGVSWYVTLQSSFLDLIVIPFTLFKSFIYTVLLGIFAGLYPALRAMRIDPVDDLLG